MEIFKTTFVVESFKNHTEDPARIAAASKLISVELDKLANRLEHQLSVALSVDGKKFASINIDGDF